MACVLCVPCVVEIRDEGHLTLTFSLESWRLAGVDGVVPLESGVGIQSTIALVRMNCGLVGIQTQPRPDL